MAWLCTHARVDAVILSPPYSATNADRANTPRMRPSWHAGSARLGTYTGTPPCERHSVSAAVCPITSSSSGRLTHVSAMCISSTVIREPRRTYTKFLWFGKNYTFWVICREMCNWKTANRAKERAREPKEITHYVVSFRFDPCFLPPARLNSRHFTCRRGKRCTPALRTVPVRYWRGTTPNPCCRSLYSS